MTRDDIIRLANEAGFVIDEKARQHQPNCIFHTHHMIDEGLTRFAALVAAAEREACAKVCEELPNTFKIAAEEFGYTAEQPTAENYAAAIRTRDDT